MMLEAIIPPWPWDQTAYVLLGPAVVFAAFFAVYGVMQWSGRALGSITVRYQPPPRLDVLEVAAIARPDFQPQVGIAMLVELEGNGFIRITQAGGKDFLIELLKAEEYWSVLRRQQRELLRALFSPGRSQVALSAVPGMFSVILALWKHTGDDLAGLGYMRREFPGGLQVLGFFVMFMGGFFSTVTYFFGKGSPFPLGFIVVNATLAAIGLVMLGGIPKLPRLTAKGRATRDEISGFREFLERAEKPVIDQLDTSPDHFSRFLPYAILFQVEGRWTKAFAHLPEAARQGGYADQYLLSAFMDPQKAAQLAPLYDAMAAGKRGLSR
jgi:hypothetical protein